MSDVQTILSKYPRPSKLKDGTEILLKILEESDATALLKFFQQLPLTDRLPLKHDVANEAVINGWVTNLDVSRVIPILAYHGENIIGDATLHMNPFGWSTHVGEIRIVIGEAYRKKGLGLLLAQHIAMIAFQLKLEKLMAMMLKDQIDAKKVFKRLGFEEEAVLKDHVFDLHGQKHDLVIMCQHLDTLWDRMSNHVLDTEKDFSGKYR
jgi:RimJ/RimL family protein N-acetyltransferase